MSNAMDKSIYFHCYLAALNTHLAAHTPLNFFSQVFKVKNKLRVYIRADIAILIFKFPAISRLFSKQHSPPECHDTKRDLISFPLCRMTSVSQLSQSDRPADLNILVQPIRTSKCVVVQ